MDYDYVIVGAGSAGATLAARLSANPSTQVALIEAGPDYGSAQAPEAMRSANPHEIIVGEAYAPYRWDALQSRRTRAQPHRTYWRGRGVGGSSAINGQIAIRGVPEDYDDWAAAGCEGWSFADVLPGFRRLETDGRFGDRDYHGDAGPIPIYRAPVSKWGAVDQALAEAALDEGYPWAADHNAPGTTGVSPYAINNRDGVRVSTNDAYLEPSRGRNNLAVFGEAHVDKVLFEANRAVGVRVLQGGVWREVRGETVIPVSRAAVHSPAILLRSGVGPAAHPGRTGDPCGGGPTGRRGVPGPSGDLPADPAAALRPAPQGISPHQRLHPLFIGPGRRRPQRHDDGGDEPHGRQPGPSCGGARPTTLVFGLLGVWVNQCLSRGTLRPGLGRPVRRADRRGEHAGPSLGRGADARTVVRAGWSG